MRASRSCHCLVAAFGAGVLGQEPPPSPQNPPASARRTALEQAVRDVASPSATSAPAPAGQGGFRLIDLSLDILGAVGASTKRDAVLETLQGGGHDPHKRGFTLQQAELSLSGAVDPYLKAEAHLVTFLDAAGETGVELEEAFATTQALPWDLQLRAGTFFTEFGRINSMHPHAWDWIDQPIVCTRFFGADGMRGPGARLSWLVPGDTCTELLVGVQNANGETMQSFLASGDLYQERPVGGRLFTEREVRSLADVVWFARAATSFELSDSSSMAVGASVAYGPNATGNGGHAAIYGGDFVYKWRPTSNERGWPFFRLQGEVIARRFHAVGQVDENDPLVVGDEVAVPADTLADYGVYLQGLWGFALGWDAGVRGEWASGSGDSFDAASDTFGRDQDAFRADRLRVSPLLQYHSSEFSRVRLQYNYDDTDNLGDQAHSIWLGFEVLIGTHPPHRY